MPRGEESERFELLMTSAEKRAATRAAAAAGLPLAAWIRLAIREKLTMLGITIAPRRMTVRRREPPA